MGRKPKPVQQLDAATGATLNVWPSACAAARGLGIHRSGVFDAARGERPSSGGFRWRFTDNAIAPQAIVAPAKVTAEMLDVVKTARWPEMARRPVRQLDAATGEALNVWPSAGAASTALGISHSNLIAAARGERPTCGGFRWRFACDSAESPAAALPLAPTVHKRKRVGGFTSRMQRLRMKTLC